MSRLRSALVLLMALAATGCAAFVPENPEQTLTVTLTSAGRFELPQQKFFVATGYEEVRLRIQFNIKDPNETTTERKSAFNSAIITIVSTSVDDKTKGLVKLGSCALQPVNFRNTNEPAIGTYWCEIQNLLLPVGIYSFQWNGEPSDSKIVISRPTK